MRPGPLLAVLVPALLVPCLLLTGGCADNVYYQTRYAPTSGEDTYSFSERLFQSEDREVYETPANPPALASGEDDDHRSRVDCRKPGQDFKAGRVAAGGGTEIHGHGQSDGPPVARMEDEPLLGRGPGPDTPPKMADWHDAGTPGARERPGLVPVANYDTRPTSQVASGIGMRQAELLAGTREDATWCPPQR